MRAPRPDSFLPLTPVVFDILVSLASGAAHGYSVLTDIRQRTGTMVRPGSLYRALNRLLADGLIEETGTAGDDRRTDFRLTALGRAVAELEAARLEAQVSSARGARLLRTRK
jgi:DNA-binding PadR family transcriptional regulator